MFKKLWQFVKFGIVGASNTIISLAAYYILIYFGMNYNLAYTIGFVLSVGNAFFWSNRYVFTKKQEESSAKAFVKLFISYGISFLLSIVIINIMVEYLHVSTVLAPILKMIVVIPINFLLNKIWAFKDTE